MARLYSVTPDLAGIPGGVGDVQEGADDDGGLSQGVFLTDTGVWVKTDDRPKCVSAVAFTEVF